MLCLKYNLPHLVNNLVVPICLLGFIWYKSDVRLKLSIHLNLEDELISTNQLSWQGQFCELNFVYKWLLLNYGYDDFMLLFKNARKLLLSVSRLFLHFLKPTI